MDYNPPFTNDEYIFFLFTQKKSVSRYTFLLTNYKIPTVLHLMYGRTWRDSMQNVNKRKLDFFMIDVLNCIISYLLYLWFHNFYVIWQKLQRKVKKKRRETDNNALVVWYFSYFVMDACAVVWSVCGQNKCGKKETKIF